MYGDGKSDRLIVAEKRSNNGCGAPQLAEGGFTICWGQSASCGVTQVV